MFKSARIKLTLWYLLIIMAISLLFSIVLYSVLSRELQRGFRRAEMRFMVEQDPLNPAQMPRRIEIINPDVLNDFLEAKRKLALNLFVLNGMIFGFSSIAGYFLAGKTLKPIENALEEQKRFVADASHEMRTPLTSLKTSMEVSLRDKKMTAKNAMQIIKSNLEEVDGLISLTNNLLSLASLQSNSNTIHQKVDIEDIVNSAIKKITPIAKSKNIKIKLDVKGQKIECNRQKIEETLTIFLDNAVKYTPKKGKVGLTAKKGGSCLIIKISDTGIGIPKKDLPHIFDRFYRVDQSRSKYNVPGFGLGLSLAQKNIRMHKGSINVNSVLGKGTVFEIRLPIKQN